ncbi:MAG: carbamoyltransferase C-terminal domain-containing protein [Alphaproteobacteria bacterium]|nr:carbamoyltransferase C-terminal domain-containing protein [Alphaproteobacteria bacterium]
MIGFPENSVLGINYSGMHDSAVAVSGPDGELLYACSLERISRVKQDGRRPDALLDEIPWRNIARVAVSTEKELLRAESPKSFLHPNPLVRPCSPQEMRNEHGRLFHDFISSIPVPVDYVCHQLSHAGSTFWASGFNSALCLTYDGGMNNCAWFGGLYDASFDKGIVPLDRFATSGYARISLLYTFVTALLGFTPNKHEGKITGLAAYGAASARCRDILNRFFGEDYEKMERIFNWRFVGDKKNSPQLAVEPGALSQFRTEFDSISKEDIAATVQSMTEEHVMDILAKACAHGWKNDNICLSGGLFSNVKLNSRVREFGFKNIFISPAMTDDGSAHGAALDVLFREGRLKNAAVKTMSVGPSFSESEIEDALREAGLKWEKIKQPEKVIARFLADGLAVAFFSGKMEFGPRALGNRSILAAASDKDINLSLNNRLSRTEFMPFAPMTLREDASLCYENVAGAERALGYMTIAVKCTDFMKAHCPAVVHVDGTARPQLVDVDKQPLIYAIISEYKRITGNPAIINTSFNIHEEPIVCSPGDAVRSFVKSKLDVLFFDTGHMVRRT